MSILSSDGPLENGHSNSWQTKPSAGNAAQDILNLLDLDNSPSTPKARPVTGGTSSALDDFAFLSDDSAGLGVNGRSPGVTITVLEKNGLKVEFTVSRSEQPDALEVAVAVNNFSVEDFSKFDMKVAPIKVSLGLFLNHEAFLSF